MTALLVFVALLIGTVVGALTVLAVQRRWPELAASRQPVATGWGRRPCWDEFCTDTACDHTERDSGQVPR